MIVTSVPRPASLSTATRPPTPAARSCVPSSPSPPPSVLGVPSPKPRPSSETRTNTHCPERWTTTRADAAPECRTTFESAS